MKNLWLKKIICYVILAAFSATSVTTSYAQPVLQLPQPGAMVNVSPKVNPSMLKGLKVDSNDPFRLEFILDKGDQGSVETWHTTSLHNDVTRLIKYFLASLTVPEKDLWVNLSPYEKDRIIPDAFGLTEMGRDLLSQDYILKQITASLIYPEGETGKKFWAEIYKQAYAKYGTTDIPVDTFNKVWIMPDKVVVYENKGIAFIGESRLKVMLESDYVSQENNVVGADLVSARERADIKSVPTNDITKDIIRSIIIPILEKEVNEGRNFSKLRQVYSSLILAAWYKRKIKDSLLASVYVDQKKIKGVNINDPEEAQKIWGRYVEAFKRGAYNYIKEEKDEFTGELIPRKYFSGGMQFGDFAMSIVTGLPMAGAVTGDFAQVACQILSSDDEGKPPAPSFEKASTQTEDDPTGEIRTQPLIIDLGGRQFALDNDPDAMTPRDKSAQDGNAFVDFFSENTGKTLSQIWSEIDASVRRQHYHYAKVEGFVPDTGDLATPAGKVHDIFRRLVKAYDRQAEFLGLPSYKGKLFIIDSPQVNAHVFSGHTDVYIHLGILRELAHYCQITGTVFSEDLIAAVLAHEMRHVMQHSAFEGVDMGNLRFNSALTNEVLALKRKAEYDADEGGMFLIGQAGYSPEAVFSCLNFLARITQQSTMEQAISTHPHAKERLTHVQTYYTSDRILPGKKVLTPLDIDPFISWEYKHVGPGITDIHSFDDVIRQLQGVRSFVQLAEVLSVFKHMLDARSQHQFSTTPEARVALARDIFYHNVVDAMRTMAAQLVQQPLGTPFSLESVAKSGLIVDRLFSEERGGWDEDITEAREGFMKKASFDVYEEQLKQEFMKVKEVMIQQAADVQERVRALDALNALYAQALEKLRHDFQDDTALERYENASATTEDEWDSRIKYFMKEAKDLQGLNDLLTALASVPFSLYHTYGQQSLDQEVSPGKYINAVSGVMASQLGLDWDSVEAGKIYLERTDSNFYVQDLRLWPVATKEERQALFDIILKSRSPVTVGVLSVAQQEGWSAVIGKILDRLNPDMRRQIKQERPEVSDNELDQFFLWLREDILARLRLTTKVLPDRFQYQRMHFEEFLGIFLLTGSLEISSSIFNQEYGKPWWAFFSHGSYRKSGYLQIELAGEPYAAEAQIKDLLDKKWGYERLRDLPDEIWSEVKSLVQDELKHYSIDFRREVLSSFLNGAPAGFWSPQHVQELCQGVIYPSDIYDVLLDFTSRILPRSLIAGLDDTRRLRSMRTMCEWLLENRPAQHKGFSKEFLHGYTILRLKEVEREMKNAFLSDDQEYGGISQGTLAKASIDNVEDSWKKLKSAAWWEELPDGRGRMTRAMDSDIQDDLKRMFPYNPQRIMYFLHGTQELAWDDVMRLSDQYLTKEKAFEILSMVASAGAWTYEMTRAGSWSEDRWIFGKVDEEKLKKMGAKETFDIPSDQVPVTLFFNIDVQNIQSSLRAGAGETLRQMLFRRIFDLSAEQLAVLSRGQKEVNDRLQLSKGRLKQDAEVLNAQELLDALMMQRVLEEMSLGKQVPVSSDAFDRLFKASIQKEEDRDRGYVSPRLVLNVKTVDKFSDEVIDLLELKSGKPEARALAVRFLERFKSYSFIGQNQRMDSFFSDLANASDLGLEYFPEYADWLREMQIPEAKKEALKASQEPRSYLEAFAKGVDLSGPKANLFKKYDKKFLDLLHSTKPLDQRIAALTRFLKKASLFRDGFIDTWERALVKGLDFSRIEMSYIEKKQQEQRKKMGEAFEEYQMFEMMLLRAPLQWEKVTAKDAQGKEVPIKISGGKAEEALTFYRQMIALVADPQRQLRMGATAMKIFRQEYPKALFDEELSAIQAFYPFASQMRDKELNALLDHHEVPGPEISPQQVDVVRRLFTTYQGMQYDTELTSANSIEQTIQATLSGASRETRIEFLLWVLDPKRNPQPKMIKSARNLKNWIFDEMPTHISYLPDADRRRIMEQIFLGENGLFSPQNAGDEALMMQVCSTLFEQFFPPRDAEHVGDGKQQFTADVYDLLRNVFNIVILEYPPARRTSVVLSLLSIYDRLDNMSDGEKLALLLSATGPVGVKVGQVLSENATLIPNDALRSQLGSLKSNGTPIGKLVAMETLLQEGFALEDIRLGKRLASASMGEVYEGALRVDGQWTRVVFKILRPNIARLQDQDINVLRKVLDHVKAHYNKDLTHMADSIKEWIDFERDLRNEAENTGSIREVVEQYAKVYPLKDGERPLAIPRVYVGDKRNVLVMEMVEGMEIGKLMGLSKVGKASRIAATLVKKGAGQAQAEELAGSMASMSSDDLVERLRKVLLYMFFVDGRFHADLHSDNVMLGDKLFPIDLGLVGSFTDPRQREGAKVFLRGVILHDTDDIIQGLEAIHAYSSQNDGLSPDALIQKIEERRGALEEKLVAIFREGRDVKHEMINISAAVSEERFPGNKDVSDFIKALTTAIWLFPTTLPKAFKTLASLREALGLSKVEYGQAIAVHGPAILRQEMRKAVAYAVSSAIDPVRSRWERMMSFIQKKHQGKKALDAFQHNIQQAVNLMAGTLPKYYSKRAPETSQFFKDRVAVIGQAKIEDVAKEDWAKVVEIIANVPDDLLEKLRVQDQLSDVQITEVKESFDVFVKVRAVLSRNGSYQASTLKLKDPRFEAVRRAMPHVSEVGMMAMALTNRIMQNRHLKRLKAGEVTGPYRDYLMPPLPMVRYWADQAVDMYLQYMAGKKDSRGNELARVFDLFDDKDFIDGTYLSDRDWLRGDRGFNILHSSDGNVDARVKYMRHTGVDIPPHFISPVVRGALFSQKQVVTPDHPATFNLDAVDILMQRTGFTDTGRFKITMVDLTKDIAVELSLTEKELDDLINLGRLGKVDVDQWEMVVPVSTEDWVQGVGANSFKSAFDADGISRLSDKAMANKGGIDLNHIDDVLRSGNAGEAIRFHLDPAQLQKLHAAQGFSPVILDIKDLTDLPAFLGIK